MAAVLKEEFSLDQIAAAVIKIRDEISKIKKEADKKINSLEEDKERLDSYLAKKLNEVGAETIKTPSGIIMLKPKHRYSTTDWENLYEFIGKNNAYHLLEKRVHQTNMSEFLEDNPDNHPKGLNIFTETKIIIRRS